MVPVLSLGTGTFGGGNSEFFKAWGASNASHATRLVDICLDAGLSMFDSSNIYSAGQAEEILGQAIKGRRDRMIISTKGSFRAGPGPNDVGSSRHHLIRAVEGSLRRLGTDYIDLYQLHGFDAKTPIEEVLTTLDDLIRSGKIRYIGCSNFSGWHLMKSLALSEKYGWPRYVAHQAYYSLIGRDFEWELMPLALDQRSAQLCGARWAGAGSRAGFGAASRCRRRAGFVRRSWSTMDRRSQTRRSTRSSMRSTLWLPKPARPFLRSR
jgi:aryl-alcohol dehydrogenase-like predicted oxidoreductase